MISGVDKLTTERSAQNSANLVGTLKQGHVIPPRMA